MTHKKALKTPGPRHIVMVATTLMVLVLLAILAIGLAGCADTTAGASSTGQTPPATRATATHAAARPTATMSTSGTPTIGGPVADFQKLLRPNGNCPGDAAAPDCYCDSIGDSNCDFTVQVTVADGAVNRIIIEGITKAEHWDTDLTFTACRMFMGGATVATVGGQVTGPGAYGFVLNSRTVNVDIEPPECVIGIN